ncbi:hypothetical protein LSH36_184g11016 [Paralvinella palmiformis]|uniref:Uncharacterized protein n=1 Tax=Paralvinella palmiformis TaxID=53620 RepID=A0AAD9JRF5_9ANNE|nr:hypothetical protein LSH36_184g11016 [Paralvinella palmiformis]
MTYYIKQCIQKSTILNGENLTLINYLFLNRQVNKHALPKMSHSSITTRIMARQGRFTLAPKLVAIYIDTLNCKTCESWDQIHQVTYVSEIFHPLQPYHIVYLASCWSYLLGVTCS